jgi:hypothetical protein
MEQSDSLQVKNKEHPVPSAVANYPITTSPIGVLQLLYNLKN